MQMEPEVVDKPWGKEIILVNTGRYVVKQLNINPKSELSVQYHEKKIETVIVLHDAGDGAFVSFYDKESHNEEESVKLLTDGRRTILTISPGTIHNFKNTGDEDVVLLEISSPELDDVVRLSDKYGRA